MAKAKYVWELKDKNESETYGLFSTRQKAEREISMAADGRRNKKEFRKMFFIKQLRVQ